MKLHQLKTLNESVDTMIFSNDLSIDELQKYDDNNQKSENTDAYVFIDGIIKSALRDKKSGQRRPNFNVFLIKDDTVIAAGEFELGKHLGRGKQDKSDKNYAALWSLGSIEKGAGSKLLKLIEKFLKTKHIKTLELNWDGQSRGFYEKMGYFERHDGSYEKNLDTN